MFFHLGLSQNGRSKLRFLSKATSKHQFLMRTRDPEGPVPGAAHKGRGGASGERIGGEGIHRCPLQRNLLEPGGGGTYRRMVQDDGPPSPKIGEWSHCHLALLGSQNSGPIKTILGSSFSCQPALNFAWPESVFLPKGHLGRGNKLACSELIEQRHWAACTDLQGPVFLSKLRKHIFPSQSLDCGFKVAPGFSSVFP